MGGSWAENGSLTGSSDLCVVGMVRRVGVPNSREGWSAWPHGGTWRGDAVDNLAGPGVVCPADARGEDGDAVLALEHVAAEAVLGADAADGRLPAEASPSQATDALEGAVLMQVGASAELSPRGS